MSRNHIGTPGRARTRGLGVVLGVAAAVLLAGCGSDTSAPPSGTDAHIRIDPVDPQALTAEGVAQAAMNAILSWQPATDTSKSDALRRAQPWIGVPLAKKVGTPEPTPAGLRPDAQWEAWKRSGDTLTAACRIPGDTPAHPDGMHTVVVDVSCRQTVLHTSGDSTRLTPQRWRTTITATADGWRLTDYRFRN